MEAIVIGAIAVGVVCGLIGACIAEQKQAGGLGFLLGLFLGPFGLLLCFFLDSRPQCPHCSEKLHLNSIVCPNCRNEVFWHSGSSYRFSEQIEKIKARERAEKLASDEYDRKRSEELRKLQEAQEELWHTRIAAAKSLCVKFFESLKESFSYLNRKQKGPADSSTVSVHRVSDRTFKNALFEYRTPICASLMILSVISLMSFLYRPMGNGVSSFAEVAAISQPTAPAIMTNENVDELKDKSNVSTNENDVGSIAPVAVGSVVEFIPDKAANSISEKPKNESSAIGSPTQGPSLRAIDQLGYSELMPAKKWYQSQLQLVRDQYIQWLEEAAKRASQANDYSEVSRIRNELNTVVPNRKDTVKRLLWVYENGYYQVLHDGKWFECEPNGTTSVFREVRRTGEYIEIQFKSTTTVRLYADRAEVRHFGMRSFQAAHVGGWE